MKFNEKDVSIEKRMTYCKPCAEPFYLRVRLNLLENLSLEGDVLDFEDGEDL